MRHKSRSFVSHFLLLMFLIPQGAVPPAVGEKAREFALSNLQGKRVRLSEATANGPVVLVVLRGYPGYQCPICNLQVRDFLKRSGEFAEAGAKVLMVYPGPAEKLDAKAAEFVADKSLTPAFELLLDPGYEFTNLYGLRWNAPAETAYPSTFVIDKDGIVFFAKVSRTHGGRTSAAETIEVLKRGRG